MGPILSLFKKISPLKIKHNHRQKKAKVLEFIENKASKTDFIHWLLNNNQDIALSEKDDWATIKSKIIEQGKVSYNQLRTFSSTLEDGAILEETLKEVEKTTKEAEETARKLSDFNALKKFSIMIGGVLLFIGVLKLILAVGLAFGELNILLDLHKTDHTLLALNIYLVTIGVFEVFGGLFLVTL